MPKWLIWARNQTVGITTADVEELFTQINIEHGDDPGELKSVEDFLEMLKDSAVGDLVDLVEPSDTVLDELGELNCRLNFRNGWIDWVDNKFRAVRCSCGEAI